MLHHNIIQLERFSLDKSQIKYALGVLFWRISNCVQISKTDAAF